MDQMNGNCILCHGVGWFSNSFNEKSKITCPRCGGTGNYPITPQPAPQDSEDGDATHYDIDEKGDE